MVTSQATTSSELEIAYLTGRTCQFIKDIAENAGVSQDLLTIRILLQLGNGKMWSPPGVEEDLPTLPSSRTKNLTTARKVAVDRRTRRKLSPKKVAKVLRQLSLAGATINSVAKKNHMAWATVRDLLHEKAA